MLLKKSAALAAAAGVDPIEFRLKYLDPNDKRGIEVLDRVAKLAKWDKRPSPKGGQSGDLVKGRGVSYCKYELVRTYIAAVAEVEVKRSTGEIRNTRPRLRADHQSGWPQEPNRRQSDPDGEPNAQGGA